MKFYARLALLTSTLLPALALAHDHDITREEAVAAGGVFAVFGGIFLLIAAIALASLVYWIVMLVDALRRANWESENQKTTWVLILILSFLFGFGFIAAVVYHIAIKHQLDSKAVAPEKKTEAKPKK